MNDPTTLRLALRDTYRAPGCRGGVGHYTIWLAQALSRLVTLEVYTQEPAAFGTCRAIPDTSARARSLPAKGWRLARNLLPAATIAGDYAGVILPHPQEPVVAPSGALRVLVLHDLIPLMTHRFNDAQSLAAGNRWRGRFWHAYQRHYLPRLLQRVDRVVVPSACSARDVLARFPTLDGRVAVIANGYNEELASGPRDCPQAVLRAAARSDGYLVCIANASAHKNVARLLQALALLRRRCDIWLVIVGIAPDRPFAGLLDGLGLAGCVICLAQVSDAALAGILAGARALVQPSLYEGFGMPPLEAMSLGVPVAAARVASLPEVCGDAAVYFDPLAVPAMATAIEGLLSDQALRRRCIAAGLAQAGRFSWARTASGFVGLFNQG